MLAIQSLPHYVKCCATFVALIHDDFECQQRYTYDSWAQGGWCRLERMIATMPFAARKVNARGEAVGKLLQCETRIIMSLLDAKGEVPILRKLELQDTSPHSFPPLDGVFGDDKDHKVPEDQRDRKKASVLVDYLVMLLEEEEKRLIEEETAVREAEQRFDGATYLDQEETLDIQDDVAMTTWEGNESKTEDGTWQMRAATEAERANRHVDETKTIEVQDDVVPEHDEGGERGENASHDETSITLTTWSSFGNDHGSYLPSVQSNGMELKNVRHSSEYSATFSERHGPVPGSGLRGAAVAKALRSIRDGVMAQPFPDDFEHVHGQLESDKLEREDSMTL